MPHTQLRRESANAFFQANHMEVIVFERDHTITELVVLPESCNPYGRVHGGAFYTLGDTAAGTAAHSDGRFYVTQNSSVHFLHNVPVGHTVRAEAHIVHRGRATCLAAVEFTDETGRLLATGDFTFFCVSEKQD